MQSVTLELPVRAIWLFIKAVIMLVVAMVGAMFALHNDQPLSVDFVLMRSPEISLGLWLILFLAIGALLGIAASGLIVRNHRWVRSKKRIKKP